MFASALSRFVLALLIVGTITAQARLSGAWHASNLLLIPLWPMAAFFFVSVIVLGILSAGTKRTRVSKIASKIVAWLQSAESWLFPCEPLPSRLTLFLDNPETQDLVAIFALRFRNDAADAESCRAMAYELMNRYGYSPVCFVCGGKVEELSPRPDGYPVHARCQDALRYVVAMHAAADAGSTCASCGALVVAPNTPAGETAPCPVCQPEKYPRTGGTSSVA